MFLHQVPGVAVVPGAAGRSPGVVPRRARIFSIPAWRRASSSWWIRRRSEDTQVRWAKAVTPWPWTIWAIWVV